MASTLQFWLTYNNRAEVLQLPVNPDRLRYRLGKMGFEDIEIAALGEFTIIGNQQLFEIEFSSFFPLDYNPTYCEYEDIPNPWDAVNMIKNWAISGNPMRVTIPGTPISLACTIRDFQIDERGGEPGDIYYTIAFKEYRFISVKTVTTSPTSTTATASTAKTRPPAENATKAKTYVVKSGDTLWAIAEKQKIGGSNWKKLYDANKKVIGGNPNQIKPGTTLVIP